MPIYCVTAWLNVSPAELRQRGYSPKHPVVTSDELRLRFAADHPTDAAEQAFLTGNEIRSDVDGRPWPTNVRHLSVGDLVAVHDPDMPNGAVTHLAVTPRDFVLVPHPARVVNDIAGTSAINGHGPTTLPLVGVWASRSCERCRPPAAQGRTA